MKYVHRDSPLRSSYSLLSERRLRTKNDIGVEKERRREAIIIIVFGAPITTRSRRTIQPKLGLRVRRNGRAPANCLSAMVRPHSINRTTPSGGGVECTAQSQRQVRWDIAR